MAFGCWAFVYLRKYSGTNVLKEIPVTIQAVYYVATTKKAVSALIYEKTTL